MAGYLDMAECAKIHNNSKFSPHTAKIVYKYPEFTEGKERRRLMFIIKTIIKILIIMLIVIMTKIL